MDDTRRQFLRALTAAGGIAALGALAFGDDISVAVQELLCPPRRSPVWSFSTSGGRNASRPVLVDDVAYVSMGYGGTTGDSTGYPLVALDRHTGEKQWQFVPEGGGTGVPLVTDHQIVVGTGSDKVFAFDRESKQQQWVYDAEGAEGYGGGAWGQPALVADTLVVGISHSTLSDPEPGEPDDYIHRVVGLEPADGTLAWERTTTDTVFAGPTPTGDDVVVADESGTVSRLAAADGTEQWQIDTGIEIRSRPRVYGGTVYVAGDARLVAVDAVNGKRRWKATLGGAVTTDAVVHGDSIFLGDGASTVSAFTLDGSRRWQFTSDAPVGAIDAAGSTVYALDHTGRLYVIDAGDGTATGPYLLVERLWNDRCGWNVDLRRATALTATDSALYASSESWVRRYEIPGT